MNFFQEYEIGHEESEMRFMLPENQGFVPEIKFVLEYFDRRRRFLKAFPLDITLFDVKTQ